MIDLQTNISFVTYGFATVAYGILALLLVQKRKIDGENLWLFIAVIVSLLWGISNSLSAYAGPYTTNYFLIWFNNSLSLFDWIKGSAWVVFLFSHLKKMWYSQGHLEKSIKTERLISLFLIVGLIIEFVNIGYDRGMFDGEYIKQLSSFNNLFIAILLLFLLENLYRNIANENRWGVRLFCLGLGAVYAFDFLLYGDLIFSNLIDPRLYSSVGAINFLVVPLLIISIFRNPKWSIGVGVSHKAAFHLISLIVGVIYLAIISALGYLLKNFGGEWGIILQVSFLFTTFVGFVAILYSGTIRSIILVWLGKYFFRYKFDYREEWLRFIGTMTASKDHYDLKERAIKSMAELMDCRGGALWYRNQPNVLSLSARWNFKNDLDQSFHMDEEFIEFIEKKNWIVDLKDHENGFVKGTDVKIPICLLASSEFWLLIPLLHHEKIDGFILLHQPRNDWDLNWEIIDILKTVSLQISSYLAEQNSVEALAVAREFEEFNRKFAFVIHDIKNMASQLSLMQKNSEKYGDNPEFQKDMQLTIKNTVDKMNMLLSRINIVQEPGKVKELEHINIQNNIENVVDRYVKAGQKVFYQQSNESIFAKSSGNDLEIVLGHIIQNALDASDDTEVIVTVKLDSKYAIIIIEDEGCGMEAEFLQNELFRPFRSLKEGGYGIGAYESRQLINSMGGLMDVKSDINQGTTVTIHLLKE